MLLITFTKLSYPAIIFSVAVLSENKINLKKAQVTAMQLGMGFVCGGRGDSNPRASGDITRTTFLFFKIFCCQEQKEQRGIIKMRDSV